MNHPDNSSRIQLQNKQLLLYVPGMAAYTRLDTLFQPIVSSLGVRTLCVEIELLPREQLLVSSAEYDVFFARSWQMPQLMHEIGRLREITFRAVGEGTGKPS